MGSRWPVSLFSSASRLLHIWDPFPNNSPPLRSRSLVLLLRKETISETPSELFELALAVSIVSSRADFSWLGAAHELIERLAATRSAQERLFHFIIILDTVQFGAEERSRRDFTVTRRVHLKRGSPFRHHEAPLCNAHRE